QQSFEIQRSAADEERMAIARLQLVRARRCHVAKTSQTCLLGWIKNIDQVVRHSVPVFDSRLGRTDVHTAIQGHRIERDDFGAEKARKFNPNLGLPRRSWA